MIEYIKKLKTKSEDTRKQALAVALIACMSFVVFVWISSLNGRFTSKKDDGEVQASNTVKPFKLFANSVSNAFSNISASVGKISSIKKDATEQKQIDLIPVEQKASQ